MIRLELELPEDWADTRPDPREGEGHECVEMVYCVCSTQALEPDEACPVHGVGGTPRCRCGRFVKRRATHQEEIDGVCG